MNLKKIVISTILISTMILFSGCARGIMNIVSEGLDSSDFPLVTCKTEPWEVKEEVVNQITGDVKIETHMKRITVNMSLSSYLLFNGDRELYLQCFNGIDHEMSEHKYPEAKDGIRVMVGCHYRISTFNAINNTYAVGNTVYSCEGDISTIVYGAGIRY